MTAPYSAGTVFAALLRDLARPAPTPACIHRIRVASKKLRAWIRLLRFAEARRMGITADRALRAMARSVAAGRDRSVMTQTLKRLQAECRTTAERRQLALVARRLRRSTAPVGRPTLPQAARILIERLCARQPEISELLRALAVSYRRTRRLGARALKRNAAPELWHRWRKRVKYLHCQTHFLYAGGSSQWQEALADLGHVLGDLQDLQVLRQGLQALPWDACTQTAERLLARAQRRGVKHARALYARCFAEKRPLSEMQSRP